MKKICIIANLLIPFLYIIKFFATKYALNSSFSGNLHILTWFAMPIVMFFINTFSEKQLRRLVPMYLISACIQIFGVFIEGLFYYIFENDKSGITLLVPLAAFVIVVLNLILIPTGIATKSIAMNNICVTSNMLISVLWIVILLVSLFYMNMIPNTLRIAIWFAMPIVMFFINTFSKKQLRRLIPMYLISVCIQILGVFIEKALYCTFFEGNVTWTQSTPLIVSILNLILIPIGIAARCIATKFKNNA